MNNFNYIEVEAGVRYWQDASVNDQEDEANSLKLIPAMVLQVVVN